MDDIRPPRNYGSTNPPTNYGRPTPPPAPPTDYQVAQQGYNVAPETIPDQHQNYNLPQHHSSGKGTKFTLVLFIILFIAAAGFAGWQYMQIKDLKADMADLQKENDRLEERVYSLNYDNRDLSQKLELANGEAAALKEENTKLQETCGNACDNITP